MNRPRYYTGMFAGLRQFSGGAKNFLLPLPQQTHRASNASSWVFFVDSAFMLSCSWAKIVHGALRDNYKPLPFFTL